MGLKPTPLQFVPLESFFMRLPSSSSLLLASLAVSSSSSSLSALAAPAAGDGQESLSSPAPVLPPPPVPPPAPFPPHAPIPHDSDDTMAQPNSHLQTRGAVEEVTALLPPELSKPILDLLNGILKPLVGSKDAPKAREQPLDVVEHLVPTGKTLRAEGADEAGEPEHAASEDSSMQPFASQPVASTPPAAGRQDAPVVAPNPPASCPSQPSPRSGPVRRQAAGGGNEGSKGGSTIPDPKPPAAPSAPSRPGGSGGNVVGGSG